MKERFTNLAMERELQDGNAIDVSTCEVNGDGDYILKQVIDGMDYCNAETEQWIWSIGKHKVTGQILASHSTKFYENRDYECLWLR